MGGLLLCLGHKAWKSNNVSFEPICQKYLNEAVRFSKVLRGSNITRYGQEEHELWALTEKGCWNRAKGLKISAVIASIGQGACSM